MITNAVGKALIFGLSSQLTDWDTLIEQLATFSQPTAAILAITYL